MKTTILFLLVMLSSVINCASQQTCRLDLKNAPSFFNLKLGMTEEEVRGVFGRELKFKPKKKGVQRTFFQNFISKPPPAVLSGVRALYLRFFNHRIYQIEVFYENRAEWPTLAKFTSALAENKDFSDQFWTPNTGNAEIKCVDFTLIADQILNPRIELTDAPAAAAVLKARLKPS